MYGLSVERMNFGLDLSCRFIFVDVLRCGNRNEIGGIAHLYRNGLLYRFARRCGYGRCDGVDIGLFLIDIFFRRLSFRGERDGKVTRFVNYRGTRSDLFMGEIKPEERVRSAGNRVFDFCPVLRNSAVTDCATFYREWFPKTRSLFYGVEFDLEHR